MSSSHHTCKKYINVLWKKYERKKIRKYFDKKFNIELKRTKDKLNIQYVLKLTLVSRNSPCWSQVIGLLYIPYHMFFFWRVLNSVIPCFESNHKT